MKNTKTRLLSMLTALVVLTITIMVAFSMNAVAAGTPITWDKDNAFGTWTVNGSNAEAAKDGQGFKKITASGFGDYATIEDFTLSAKMYVGADTNYSTGGPNGSGPFISFRDQGTTTIETVGSVKFDKFGFNYDQGYSRFQIFFGDTEVGGYGKGYYGDPDFSADQDGYLSFSVTVIGDKITELNLGGVDATGILNIGEANKDKVVTDGTGLFYVPTGAGTLAVGSYCNKDLLELKAGIKDVNLTVLKGVTKSGDVSQPGGGSSTPSTTPVAGDNNLAMTMGIVLLISAMTATVVVVSKRQRAE